MFTAGCGLMSACLFHLINHAFFKCLLFLCSGSIIHSIGDNQDIRKMGAIINFFPFTYSCMVIGSFSLIAFPYFSGFYSKDLLLEMIISEYTSLSWSIYIIAIICSFFTSFYSFRLIKLIFFGSSRIKNKLIIAKIEEAPMMMMISMIILSILSIVSGYLLKDIYSSSSLFWRASITDICHYDYHFLNSWIKILPTIASIMGVVMGIIIFANNGKKSLIIKKKLYSIFFLQNKKFFFDSIYNFIGRKFLNYAYYTNYKLIDRGLFEKLGPNGLYNIIVKFALLIRLIHTGYIFHYIFYVLLILVFISFCFIIL
jgi:NADH:ubiquinone oxidoreductase subunit 5 (subunit L)/multisubunit Na+/H+ antiporter MnhA subunit